MHEHQVQRTLVKSRPELWAELSQAASLGKHLNDFGEITITRLEPETSVAWEGTAARGTVELETSGWGTKVTLTAEVLDVEPAPEAAAPEPEPEPVAVVQPEPEPEPVAVVQPEPEPEPVVVPDPEPVAVTAPAPDVPTPATTPTPAPAPARTPTRGGFLSRLFGGRRTPPAPAPTPAERAAARAAARSTAVTPVPVTTDEPTDEPAPLRAVPEPETPDKDDKVVPLRPPTPTTPDPDPDESPDESPDDDRPLVARLDAQQALAVLESALDDLGAAHRRPFSHS